MTQTEFIKAIDGCDNEIEKYKERKQQLKREYIESQPIKPKQFVVVDGNKVWLDGYAVVGYHIHPRLFKLNRDGTKSAAYYNAVNDKTMHEIEG